MDVGPLCLLVLGWWGSGVPRQKVRWKFATLTTVANQGQAQTISNGIQASAHAAIKPTAIWTLEMRLISRATGRACSCYSAAHNLRHPCYQWTAEYRYLGMYTLGLYPYIRVLSMLTRGEWARKGVRQLWGDDVRVKLRDLADAKAAPFSP
jgi:hypothetical protein